MKLIVASDTHIGSVGHAELDDYMDLIKLDENNEHMILTGDVVDMTNCSKKKVNMYVEVIKRLQKHFGDRYVLGNHCAQPIGAGYGIIAIGGKKVLYFHGTGIRINNIYHAFYYSRKTTVKWERKKWGRGKFSALKYKVWRMFSKHKGGYKKPPTKIIDSIVGVCELLDCDVAIFGHTHRSYDAYHGGKRIINVPKGISYLEI